MFPLLFEHFRMGNIRESQKMKTIIQMDMNVLSNCEYYWNDHLFENEMIIINAVAASNELIQSHEMQLSNRIVTSIVIDSHDECKCWSNWNDAADGRCPWPFAALYFHPAINVVTFG